MKRFIPIISRRTWSRVADLELKGAFRPCYRSSRQRGGEEGGHLPLGFCEGEEEWFEAGGIGLVAEDVTWTATREPGVFVRVELVKGLVVEDEGVLGLVGLVVFGG